MNDCLVIFGPQLPENRRKEVYDHMRHAEGVTACCHVAETIFGVRTAESHPELFSRVQKLVEPDLVIVVAPLAGAWSSRHALSAFRCFRQSDDD